MKEIQAVFTEIQCLEAKFRISNEIGREQELNFGLVNVVYQWASEKVRKSFFITFQLLFGLVNVICNLE